jgi:hypothetical protein
VSEDERTTDSPDPEAQRERNLETLRQSAREGVQARPAGRVIPLALERHRVPVSVVVALLALFAVLTVLNVITGGHLQSAPPGPTDAELERSLELTAGMQADWIDAFSRANGRLPVAGEELSIDPEMGRYEATASGYVVVARGADGREVALSSIDGRREITATP